jgi:uncharacterized protein (DUF1800 family)
VAAVALSKGIAAAAAAPDVAGLTPDTGPSSGGTTINVSGYGFQSGATVLVGTAAAGAVSVSGLTRLSATAPSAPPGTLQNVRVTNPDSSTAQLAGGWFADYLDVAASHPFHTAIVKISRKGITTGCGSGNYCPEQTVTRGQMAVFLLRGKHGGSYSPPAATGTVFTDVPASAPFAKWIERLAAEGITSGCGSNKYCPDQSVTRGEMAVFLLRSEHGTGFLPSPATGALFGDVPASAPFARWIEQLAGEGVTSGCGPGAFCPSSSSTRAQMAAFLTRTFNADIVRFLEQATFGPTDALIAHVRQVGITGYLDEQFAAPTTGYPDLPLQPDEIPLACDSDCQRDNYTTYPLQRQFFTNALYGEDQLRQRVAWALHRMFVVSGWDLSQPSWMTPYLQIFDRNAFGHYRHILGEITLNPAMGDYLDMMDSTKWDPNENYAREVLQLFSIGVNKLNPDGTTKLDGQGLPVPTYDQSVVTAFARVFTGWTGAPPPSNGVPNYLDPMVLVPDDHDTGGKTLLDGAKLPAGQTGAKDLNDALDNIFHHPNVGPFVSRHLIRSLVTSNPSPGYVARVSAVFDDDGIGVRGDLKAVVRAILLDPEARGDVKDDPDYGHLKEPVLFVTNILRAFNAHAAADSSQSDGYLDPFTWDMSQDVFRPDSVFSYYPADYVVPGTSLAGPEFGILNATTALARANFIQYLTFWQIDPSDNGPKGTALDLTRLEQLAAANPDALLSELDRLLLHGTMSPEMRASIRGAVDAISVRQPQLAAPQALYLVATSSQYQVER